ncbi:MAG: universal stress protein [Rhodospirillaceae bacterium]|nr:universal stress protein [Rhodospirillaceae bacterium]MBT6140104.1 universal stress protein [Rhodospirillaceae bacterium]
MPIKTILVPMMGGEADGPALNAAGNLAKRSGAHVDAVFVHRDPRAVVAPQVGEGVSASMIEALVKSAQKEYESSRDDARTRFDTWCSEAGIEIQDRPGKATGASAAFSEMTGEPAECVTKRGRTADVISVTRVGDRDNSDQTAVLEAALMETGRLVLQVPPQGSVDVGKTVAIAWNGSKEASRTAALALPVLEGVESAVVIAGISDYLTADDVNSFVDSLAWHGVNVTARTFPLDGGSVSGRLQAEARSAGADTILLGAYSHSRLRELVFGGVTADVLDGAHMPVLMAH